MATILIRGDTHQLELLLRAVVEHLGHEAVVLGREPQPGVDTGGDLLLLDPRSAGAVEGATELRSHDPELPIVCVGADRDDPWGHALRPAAIVPKPFRYADLVGAISRVLASAAQGQAPL